MTIVFALLAAGAAALGMRIYDRRRLEGSIANAARFKAENIELRKQIAALELAIHHARRADWSHDDAARRLLELAGPDSAGRV